MCHSKVTAKMAQRPHRSKKPQLQRHGSTGSYSGQGKGGGKHQQQKKKTPKKLPKQNAYEVTFKNSVLSEVTTTSGGDRENHCKVSSKMVLSGPEEEGMYKRFSCFAVHSKMSQSTNAKSKPLEGLYTDTDPDDRSEIITDITIRIPGKAGTMMMEVKVDPGVQPSCIPLHKFKTLFPHLCRDGLPKEGLLDNTQNEFQSYNGGDMTCYGHLLIGLPRTRDSVMQDHRGFEETIPQLIWQTWQSEKSLQHQGGHHSKASNTCQKEGTNQVKGQGVGLPDRRGNHHRASRANTTGLFSDLSWKLNGEVRVCLDPSNLNKAIIREHHKPMTVEEIAHELAGATVYTKVNALKAFLQIHLMHEASLLMMFNSHRGQFWFLWMPFGAKMSQDVFQLWMDAILEQCLGVIGIYDDMVIFGVDQENHDANLINLLNVCQKEGLVLNSKKLELRRERVTFFGAEYSTKGMHPDPKKVQGITEMRVPMDKQQLQAFQGMVN